MSEFQPGSGPPLLLIEAADWEDTFEPFSTVSAEQTQSQANQILSAAALTTEDAEDPNWEIGQKSGLYLTEKIKAKFVRDVTHTIMDNMDTFLAQPGYVAPEELRLCSLRAMVLYPDCFVGNSNREKVTDGAFVEEKLFNRKWNFFYLHYSNKVLFFVPTAQFEDLLSETNEKLGTNLTIPSGKARKNFEMSFQNDGTNRPRYLGETSTPEMAKDIKTAVPPHYYKPDKGDYIIPTPAQESLAAYKEKMRNLMSIEKAKKAKTKQKRQEDKAVKQKSWSDEVKRVCRYLGLAEKRIGHHQVLRKFNNINPEEIPWGAYDDAIEEALANPENSSDFDIALPARFTMEEDVVFVCVDIEAYEVGHSQITEVGIATLDTRDIVGVAIGEGNKNWYEKIRPRHFRIQEYAHLRNSKFVSGCPDRFDFGKSEFIPLADAPKIVASCFKYPFSGPIQEGVEEPEKRNVIFVGHDAPQDVAYLKKLGYNIMNLPPFEVVDTAEMYRALRREDSNRNLGSVLADLNIAGWNLHNAGNDAMFTLQSMVAIAIRSIKDREARIHQRENEERIRLAMEQAKLEEEEDLKGWESDGGDGGSRVPPTSLLADTKLEPQAGQGKKTKAALSRATARPIIPDLSELKALAARASGSDDPTILLELANQAQNKTFEKIMMHVADGVATAEEKFQWNIKFENVRKLVEWESSTWTETGEGGEKKEEDGGVTVRPEGFQGLTGEYNGRGW